MSKVVPLARPPDDDELIAWDCPQCGSNEWSVWTDESGDNVYLVCGMCGAELINEWASQLECEVDDGS